eukprot:TRINITY_DN11819_c0_g1_i1.p1 TRINITY_DN11819_c0_g1~~TRINITY_DN11819_c0_g1_i1.p1  ORF type:complete len:346 (+),score=69.40 TRINITY_DN11819_c0_g1_i1:16-1053(+)
MDDLEGYREARAAQWNGRGAGRDNFELEQFLGPFLEGGGDGQFKRFGLRAVCPCLVLLLSLLSIGSLMPLQYGLTMNLITRQVNEDNVYLGGRHLIGPWNTFIAFPSTMVTVTFADRSEHGPLATRTKDGLSLTLQLSFQYKVSADSIGKLYRLANLQYEPLFVRNSRDVLLKAAADYEASEYWENRDKIGSEMQMLLDKRLSSMYATCAGLQVLVIDLPKEFEASIVQTQVQEQMVKTRQNDQKVTKIQADTTVIEAIYKRNVTVTRMGADAEFTQVARIAAALADQRLLQLEAETMRRIQTSLNLNAKQMVAYQQFVSYRSMGNATFVYGLGDKALLTLPVAP